ncbi:MAG: hypothetical protein IH991_11160 [Planctomycetes bacterium]|nr:hypothetical protein [Planctomycetota bacterium]
MPSSETTSASRAPVDRLPRGLQCALGVVIAAGLAMRLIYPADTAFTEDQAYACALAQDIANGHWQTGGLLNSGDFRNPPGFVYVLAAVWKVFPDPLALIRFIGFVNCLAVLAAWWLMRRWGGSAAAWWGTAFFAAAPWAILYSRWLWAQHLLFPAALVVYFFLWRWVVLGKRWAALGVVLGLTLLVQIHLGAVVLALAIGLVLLWLRPRLPLIPLTIGVVLAIVSITGRTLNW